MKYIVVYGIIWHIIICRIICNYLLKGRNIMRVNYEIKIIPSTTDKLYAPCIKIYTDNTPVAIKTSTNEIAQYVNNPTKDPQRRMFFFALLCNSKIIGFSELGYIYKTKTLFIDYITFDTSEKTNSNFYSILNLLIDSVSAEKCEVNYIITEISNRDNGQNLDDESLFFRKLISLEDFHIIDEPYIHPQLGENTESEFDCSLSIKIIGGTTVLNRETYLMLVYDIYYSHYLTWYTVEESNDITTNYHQYIESCYAKIVNKLGKKDTIEMVNNQVVTCHYYGKDSCFYSNSTAGSGSAAKEKQKQRWWIPLLISAICLLISLGIYKAMSFF